MTLLSARISKVPRATSPRMIGAIHILRFTHMNLKICEIRDNKIFTQWLIKMDRPACRIQAHGTPKRVSCLAGLLS